MELFGDFSQKVECLKVITIIAGMSAFWVVEVQKTDFTVLVTILGIFLGVAGVIVPLIIKKDFKKDFDKFIEKTWAKHKPEFLEAFNFIKAELRKDEKIDYARIVDNTETIKSVAETMSVHKFNLNNTIIQSILFFIIALIFILTKAMSSYDLFTYISARTGTNESGLLILSLIMAIIGLYLLAKIIVVWIEINKGLIRV
ncbi:MAG: hypothetical protein WCW13_04610 [archaeon]|jgi:hypothetical protein